MDWWHEENPRGQAPRHSCSRVSCVRSRHQGSLFIFGSRSFSLQPFCDSSCPASLPKNQDKMTNLPFQPLSSPIRLPLFILPRDCHSEVNPSTASYSTQTMESLRLSYSAGSEGHGALSGIASEHLEVTDYILQSRKNTLQQLFCC